MGPDVNKKVVDHEERQCVQISYRLTFLGHLSG